VHASELVNVVVHVVPGELSPPHRIVSNDEADHWEKVRADEPVTSPEKDVATIADDYVAAVH
jgi:hypothetical protein